MEPTRLILTFCAAGIALIAFGEFLDCWFLKRAALVEWFKTSKHGPGITLVMFVISTMYLTQTMLAEYEYFLNPSNSVIASLRWLILLGWASNVSMVISLIMLMRKYGRDDPGK